MRTILVALAAAAASAAVSAPASALERGSTCAGAVRPLGTPALAYAAVVIKRTRAYRRPGRTPFARFRRLNGFGVRTVLGVRAAVLGARCAATWYLVQLPRHPNGVVGYVRARDVRVGSVRTRILVNLSARRLVLYRGGKAVLTTAAGIGKPSTPTPQGRFYVNQRYVPPEQTGPYGPAALGISAFSPTLKDWPQGGPIAIHGTDEPSSIGRAASYGCIRVANRVMRRLSAQVPMGTPVEIRG